MQLLMPEASSAYQHSVDLAFRPILGSTVLSEYPKSGGTWIAQMLAAATGMSLVREGRPPLNRYVIHKHTLPGILSGRRPVVVMRDGRDALLSLYFHAYFLRDRRTTRLTSAFAEALPLRRPEDVRENLPRFIERQLSSPVYPRFTWSEFVERWADRGRSCVVTYEDALLDPERTVRRLLSHLGVEQHPSTAIEEVVANYSFRAMTGGRRNGEADRTSFLRKGVAGDWKNHFSDEAAQIFEALAGSALVTAGYEQDGSWVDELKNV